MAGQGLDGHEVYTIRGIADLKPGAVLPVEAKKADGSTVAFQAVARVDSPIEIDYLRHGGILQMVLRNLTQS